MRVLNDSIELAGVKIIHHFGGGTYAKETRIPTGCLLTQHVHQHDHLSILASGIVHLDVDGETSEISAPSCLTIAAGKRHSVMALTDVIWYCVHATDDTDPTTVDAAILSDGANG